MATAQPRPVGAASALSHTPEAGLAAAEAADAVGVALEGACDLTVVFATADHHDALDAIAAAVDMRLEPDVMIGAVAEGVVGPGKEVESGPAVSVWAASLGNARALPFRSWAVRTAGGGLAVAGWPDTAPGDLTLVLADPYSFPMAEVASKVGGARPGHVLAGGLVSGGEGRSRLVLDGQLHDDGAIGVVLSDLDAEVVVSQGCRPIGEPLVVTAAESHRVLELGGVPATTRLDQLLTDAEPEVRELLRRGGLLLGFVIDEVRDDYGTGDFLVRGVLDVEPDGGLTVGEPVRVGQTVQFHVRDAASASRDLDARLERVSGSTSGVLLFTCNGRGRGLFDRPDHDVTAIERALGAPVAGAFCAGELGPVGRRSFLHGFTASMVVLPGGRPGGADPASEGPASA